MGSLVVVALPSETDRVNRVSSEKEAHCTVLFLGDADENTDVLEIVRFVEHAASMQHRFYLTVDRRGELGDDKADVLFFKAKGSDFRQLNDFRSVLLQNSLIRKAYDSTEQFPEFVPHLTLGYPATPAKQDDHDFGFYSVDFDRIAVWFGDYKGPEFLLKDYDFYETEMAMSDTTVAAGAEFIAHHGVKGMKWGVRKERTAPEATAAKADVVIPQSSKRKTQIKTEGGENQPAHPDAVKAATTKQILKKSGTAALSDQELRDLANRMDLEQRVDRLNKTQGGEGQKFIKSRLRGVATQQADRLLQEQVRRATAK